MKATKRVCVRCEFFQTKQGKGKEGICQFMPLGVVKEPTSWCGQFSVNLMKYHVDGKKIYTRIDTKKIVSGGTIER